MTTHRSAFLRVRGAVYAINSGMAVLAGWVILLVTIIGCYGVFTRHVLNDPDTWSFEVSAYLLSLVIFFSASDALQKGIHVRIDFLSEWFPGRFTRFLGFIAELCSLAFLYVFLIQVWKIFHQSYTTNRIDESTLALPVAFVQWVLPFGVFFMLVTQVFMIVSRFCAEPDPPQLDGQ